MHNTIYTLRMIPHGYSSWPGRFIEQWQGMGAIQRVQVSEWGMVTVPESFISE